MKRLIFLTLVFISITSIKSFCQSTIYYRYDQSGNRTARDIVLNPPKGDGNDSQQYAEKKEDITNEEVFSERIGKTSILIYPNPTSGQIVVDIEGLEESSTDYINLIDQSGRLLLTTKPVSINNRLDLSNLKPGIYFMVINLKSGITRWNIIKK